MQPAPAAVAEEEDEGEVDETGVEPKDVELVMTQVPPPSPPARVHARGNILAPTTYVIDSS